MTGCSSLSVLTRSLTQSTLFPVLCSGLGKGPGAALQGTVCGGGIPWNLPLYSSTFDCMLSYNEVSRESFKCPGFFSSSKTIPFPQIHKGSTLPTLPFSSLSRVINFMHWEKEHRPDPLYRGALTRAHNKGWCFAVLWIIANFSALFSQCFFLIFCS